MTDVFIDITIINYINLKEEEEKNPVLFKLYEYLKTIKKTSTKKAKG